MPRDKLPSRRHSENVELTLGRTSVTVQLGYDPEGQVKEVFCATNKFGSDADTAIRDVAVLISFLLQYGCDMQEVIDVLASDTYGNPEGVAGMIARHIVKESKANERP